MLTHLVRSDLPPLNKPLSDLETCQYLGSIRQWTISIDRMDSLVVDLD